MNIEIFVYLEKKKPSRQDGGVGRYTLPPHTTKRTTMNLKAKTNQNCQKIKLYGSPTTKELKKKHSSRSVGGAEAGSQVERTLGKAAAAGPGEVVVCRVGSLTFPCRETRRNN